MSLDHYTPDEERRCDRTADVLFDLWHDAEVRQTEAGLKFSMLITGGDARIPHEIEVRSWIAGVVRGSLVRRKPELSRWEKIKAWFEIHVYNLNVMR